MPQQLNIKIFNGKVFILGSKIIRCNKGVKILARTTKKTRDQINLDYQQASLQQPIYRFGTL
jgi:hypothetical protein